MPYKMYGIMHNLHNIKTTQWILSTKEPECEALHFSTKNSIIQCWKLKLFLNFRVHSQRECTLAVVSLYTLILPIECIPSEPREHAQGVK